ncbi:MAG TPA: hypothetical protein VJH20_00540 [Candidatus Nanoarchaeia archaeon]|nr:hypothetical protein [Candidatus Nanoarchaeia archaeon]
MKNAFYIADYVIIGIDFDGVLAQGYKTKIKYAKKLFNLDLNINQTKRTGFNNLIKSMGRTDITYDDLIKEIMGKYTLEYEVPKYCKEVLTKLFLENFRFAVITSRTNEEYPYAKAFIKDNYGKLISNIHNESSHPNLLNRWRIKFRKKYYFVKKLKPRIYIDDDIKKLKALENYPVELFYCRQPENLDKNLGTIDKIRINEFSDWKNFYDIAIQLKELHEAICWKYNIINKFANAIELYNQVHGMTNRQKQNLIRDYRQQKTAMAT